MIKAASTLIQPPLEYLLEWTAAQIARAIDVRVPSSFAVTLSPDLLDPERRDPTSITLASSTSGRLYGSEFIPHALQWPPDETFELDRRIDAARILVFDVFIHNDDRRRDNPNLLVLEDAIVAIDHELAFSFLVPIVGAIETPELASLRGLVHRHALCGAIGKRADSIPSLHRFEQEILGLDADWWRALLQAAPRDWMIGPASGKLEQIVETLGRRSERAADWISEVDQRLRE